MIASIGFGTNAASNVSFNFYVDSAGNSGNSSAVNKNLTDAYAYVKVGKVLTSASNLSMTNYIRQGSTRVSSAKSLTAAGSYQFQYYSGKNIINKTYNIYGKTATSCGYGVTLQGTWTP